MARWERKVPDMMGTATFTTTVKMRKPMQKTPVATIHSLGVGV